MSFDNYMRDISRIPLLTCNEEIVLGTQVQAMMQVFRDNGIEDQVSSTSLANLLKNFDPEAQRIIKRGLKARARMISANMRLVVKLAKRSLGTASEKRSHMKVDDLIQEGAIGLVRAVEKFEPNRGYKFSTYAYWWIRQGITRATESKGGMIKVPAHMQRIVRNTIEARVRLFEKLAREPSFTEIANAIGEESQEKVRHAIMNNPTIVSLDLNLGSEKGSEALIDILSADDETEIQEKERIGAQLDFILMMINGLTESEQEVIRLAYGIGVEQASTKEMAERKNLTPQAVKNQQQKIVKKLRVVASNFAMPGD